MLSLNDEFKRFRNQPIEIITESGFKFCGIDVDSDDFSVLLIDKEGRAVRIENRHIEAVIEPQMKLKRICKDNDCDCDDDDDDRRRCRNRNDRDDDDDDRRRRRNRNDRDNDDDDRRRRRNNNDRGLEEDQTF